MELIHKLIFSYFDVFDLRMEAAGFSCQYFDGDQCNGNGKVDSLSDASAFLH